MTIPTPNWQRQKGKFMRSRNWEAWRGRSGTVGPRQSNGCGMILFLSILQLNFALRHLRFQAVSAREGRDAHRGATYFTFKGPWERCVLGSFWRAPAGVPRLTLFGPQRATCQPPSQSLQPWPPWSWRITSLDTSHTDCERWRKAGTPSLGKVGCVLER